MNKLNQLFRSSLRMKAVVFYLVFAMATITVLPRIGMTGTISTQKSVEATAAPTYDRAADIALIMGALNSDNGKIAMARVGVTAQQMEINIGKLSNAQLSVVSEKLRAALPAGGDEVVYVGGGLLLLIIVVVVLILILSKSSMATRY